MYLADKHIQCINTMCNVNVCVRACVYVKYKK